MFEVLIKILRAGNLFVSDLKKTLVPYPLNASEFSVLEFLYNKQEQTVDEIRKRILLSSGSVTYVIDNLEKKSYVERRQCQSDRRIYYIHLTTEGRRLMDEIFPIHKENTKKLFEEFTNEELDTLNQLLRKFNKGE